MEIGLQDGSSKIFAAGEHFFSADTLPDAATFDAAIHVFGRAAADFNPALDSIVRVEASRLRSRLQRYYANEGAQLRVLIDLPVGGYVATLRWASATGIDRKGGVRQPVVVVLPFDGLGGDEIDQWSDALTEELTESLARMPEIRVVARTSAMQFKGTRRDIRDVARVLSADVLIEGSLQREGDALRAVAQIITANDGLHLWPDAVVGDASARFRFFDVVCAMVRRAMPLVVQAGHHQEEMAVLPPVATMRPPAALPLPSPDQHLRAVQPDIPESVRDLYGRDRIAVRIRTTASLARATALFTEALAAAPKFARGH